MTNSLTTISCFSCLLLVYGTTPAHDINYDELEEIFGEPVTTIATGKPQRKSEAPVSIDIITEKEIHQLGAMDVPELLRLVAGVEIYRNFKGQADVNIRGYNQPFSNRLLVLINGRQVYQDSLGFTLWTSFPIQMSEIKQIEIVRGPNTSLLGFNAASGVVNIITTNPSSDSKSHLEVRAGSQNYTEASIVHYSKPSERLAARFSAGQLNSDDFNRDGYPKDISREDMLDRKNANLDVSFKLNDQALFRFDAGYTDLVSDLSVSPSTNGVMDIILKHIKLSSTFDSDAFGFISSSFYRNESNYTASLDRFASQFPPTPDTENKLNVFQLSSLKVIDEKHSVRLASELRRNSLQGDIVGVGGAKFSIRNIGLAAMWEYKVSEAIMLTNSVRFDNWKTDRDGETGLTDTLLGLSLQDYQREETDSSYNTNFVYQWSPALSTRISLAKGLHLPSLSELSRALTVGGFIENYGNPLLEPEENTTIEFGVSYALPSGEMEVGLSVFRQHLENLIVQTLYASGIGNPKADVTVENVGESRSVGVEVYLKKEINDYLNFKSNYSYMNLDDQIYPGFTTNVFYEDNQPRHKFNLLLTYSVGKLSVSSSLHYTDGFVYRSGGGFSNPPVALDVDSYSLLGANVAYQLSDELKIGVHLYNLLEDHHERPGFLVDPAVAGGVEIGKSILFTIRFEPRI